MDQENLTPEQERCKEIVIKNRGWWTELFDDILRLDPQWIANYSEFSSHPGEVLNPKMKEFIHIAVDAITTKLFNVGIRFHMEKAFDAGATVDELVEVVELSVNAGIYSTLIEGETLLAEEAEYPDADSDTEARYDELEDQFEDAFGYWSNIWEPVMKMDPEHFEQTIKLFERPWKSGALDTKQIELINVAMSMTTTHLYHKGTRVHMKRALEVGATREEVLATIQVASVVGQHTTDEAIPILVELAEERGMLK